MQSRKFCVVLAAAVLLTPWTAFGAELFLAPGSGNFALGRYFNVGIFTDTKGQEINAVSVILEFPPDKLQVDAPSLGQSIIGVWTMPPSYDNAKGIIKFEGGIPGGYNAGAGLISTVTFHVRQGGPAVLRFSPDSKILLADGQGTDALRAARGGEYILALPPAEGPRVSSATHPDESKWYRGTTAALFWPRGAADAGYSYILSEDAQAPLPDKVISTANSVQFENLRSGTHYFRLKAFRDGSWGGITEYILNVDNEPPAQFDVKVSADSSDTSRLELVRFFTTDALSGLSHYEYKLTPPGGDPENQQFAEGKSPLEFDNLKSGKYGLVVRAYDKAGNYRDISAPFRAYRPFFEMTPGEEVRINSSLWTIPSYKFWILVLEIFLGFVALGWILRRGRLRDVIERILKQ